MSGKSNADHTLVGWSCYSTEESRVTLPRKPVSVYWAFILERTIIDSISTIWKLFNWTYHLLDIGSILVWGFFLASRIPREIFLEVNLFKKNLLLKTCRGLFLGERARRLPVRLGQVSQWQSANCIIAHYGTLLGKIFWPRILQWTLCVVIKICDSVSKTSPLCNS